MSKVYDSTLFSGDPYYDDFDESKGFLRLLFRPGYAVQARELTQLQTILQAQIERFGSHIFEDGSIVLGSQVTEDDVNFARIETVSGTNTLSDLRGLNIIKSDGSSAKAIVLHTLEATANDNYDIIFFDYIEGGTGITNGDAITTTGNSLTTLYTTTITGATSGFTGQSMGTAKLVTVSEGVRFVDGFFVLHDEQRNAPFELTGSGTRYFEHPSNILGFDITKEIVDEDDDTTLVDNAFGSYNYAAPGAHRYKVDLTLNSYEWDPTALGTASNYSREDFIEILKLNDGTVVFRSQYPEYAVLEDTLARRTYDESGNYTVRTFDMSLVDAETSAQFAAKLEPGKAYVFGYEFETIAPTQITLERSRGSAAERAITAVDFDRTIGSYVNVTFGGGTGSIGYTGFDLDLHYPLSLGTAQAGNYGGGGITAGKVIGTARPRQLFENGDGTYRLYVYDISMTGSNVFEDVRSFWVATGSSGAAFYVHTSSQVGASTTGNTLISAQNSSNLLFEVPNGVKVKSIDSLDYRVSAYYPNVPFTAGVAVIGTGYTATVVDFAGGSEFLNLGVVNKSIVIGPTGVDEPGTAGKTGTRQFEIRLTNTTVLTGGVAVDLDVTDPTASFIRYKSITTATIDVTGTTGMFVTDSNGNYYINLNGLVDVYSVSGITAGLVAGGVTNALAMFNLDTGQRDNIYDWSRIVLKSPDNAATITGPYLVNLSRFTHSGWGPFTVNSYNQIEYDDIPYYTSTVNGYVYDLRDCIDFRPIKESNGGITAAFTPQVGEDFEGGYTHYLPRSAKLVLKRDRTFDVLYGPYDVSAPIPPDSDDAMTLYILRIPEWTHNHTDVGVRFVENKRYTMRDIGRLEKRIEDVEYFTTLSLLEQEAKNLTILDSLSIERPKNGILVDGFKNQGVGNITDVWHRAAIDSARGELRPSFDLFALGATFADAGASAGVYHANDIIMLPYSTTKVAVAQPFVSTTESLNIYGIHNWNGSLKVNPFGEPWFDDQSRPTVRSNTSAENDAWIGSGYSFGYNQSYGFWDQNWYGVPVIDDENIKQINPNISNEADADIYGKIPLGTKKSTAANIDAIKKTISNRTANLSVMPFISAQTVTLNAAGLKPLTTHYVFFDGNDVTASCTGTLTTDANGAISGVSLALAASTYKCGEKLIRITDSSTNNLATTTSAADSIFYATSLYATKEDGIYGIRPAVAKRASVRSEVITTNVMNRDLQRKDASNYKAYDPMAQEFKVSPRDYPNGLFVSSIRVCFSTVDENLPVGISIRPLVNGYPHPSKIVPGSEKFIAAGSANSGTDPEVNYTEFVFDNPVYLAPGSYAFTISSAGKGYALRSAVIGAKSNFGGYSSDDRVTPSADVGGLFLQQNSGTWKKDNLKSLYFVVRRCVFSTNARVKINNSGSNPYPGASKSFGAYRISAPTFLPSATNIVWNYSTIPNIVVPNTLIPLGTESVVNITAANAYTVYADLITNDNAVSPILDESMFRFIGIQNNIEAYDTSATDTELLPSPGAAAGGDTVASSRYISRKVTLRDGFESSDINVYLLANLPANTSIEVYARYQKADDTTRFEDIEWTQLSLKSGYAASISTSDDFFQELAYATGDLGTNFKTFAVKIVFYSSDSAKIPRIKNLRAIALPAP